MFKRYFPIFQHRPGIAYLDSAASSLKPQSVIDAVARYFTEYSANIARGVYAISEKATKHYERVRKISARFIGSDDPREIIFTRNTTESINLLARTLLEQFGAEDEIAVTEMEHHSNFVPWQQLAKQKGLRFVVIPFQPDGTLDPDAIKKHITKNTRIFACTHASNVFGTIHPLKDIIRVAREQSEQIITVVDAAQSAPHIPIDIKDMNCDFLAFSSHKLFGPTGAGVLWGKFPLLASLPPFLFGGEMIQTVTRDSTTFQDPPHRFEAGTPAIGEVIGMGAAIDFIQSIGFETIQQHEKEITQYAFSSLQKHFGNDITILGPEKNHQRVPLLAFTLKGVHPHDIAQILAEDDICIRSGSHCALPLHAALHLETPASARISFSLYTEKKDIDRCIKGLQKAQKIFSPQ